MTSTVASEKSAAWFPRLLGVLAVLMALVNLLDLFHTPADLAQQVLFGFMFTGTNAQAVTVMHIVLFVIAACACFVRKAVMVWVAIGYFSYLIIALWVRSTLYNPNIIAFPLATTLRIAAVSAVLLACCRVTWGRRAAFNR